MPIPRTAFPVSPNVDAQRILQHWAAQLSVEASRRRTQQALISPALRPRVSTVPISFSVPSNATHTSEKARERRFQRREEDRDRIFQDNETRREEESTQHREVMIDDFSIRGHGLIAGLEQRITTIRPRPSYGAPIIRRMEPIKTGSPSFIEGGPLLVSPSVPSTEGVLKGEGSRSRTLEGSVVEGGVPSATVVEPGAHAIPRMPSMLIIDQGPDGLFGSFEQHTYHRLSSQSHRSIAPSLVRSSAA
jgi:hypothetical protein